MIRRTSAAAVAACAARACAAYALCAILVGCKAPRLCVDDTVIVPGRSSDIRVHALRDGLFTPGRQIAGVEVAVYVGDRKVAAGKTNRHGFVDLDAHLPRSAREIRARAVILGEPLASNGRVYHWPIRTAVVVDVDQTISQTDYRSLLLDKSDLRSKPLPGSVQTLNRIARHFNIYYLTARPREVLETTRDWIRRHGFPAGPIHTSDSLHQAVDRREYKLEAIEHVQSRVPHVRIGIGDKASDSQAYGQAGMLTVILVEGGERGFAGHAVLLRDWGQIGRFFQANARIFRNPRQLETALRGQCLLLRPTLLWTRPK